MQKYKNSGFTLVELVVTIAVVGLLATTMTGILFDTMKAGTKSKAVEKVEEEGSSVVRDIRRNLLGADPTSIVCPTDPANRYNLTFRSRINGEITEIVCDEASSQIASQSAQRVVLHSSGVEVSSSCANFVNCDVSGATPVVDFSFGLQTSGNTEANNSSSRDFNVKVVLRN